MAATTGLSPGQLAGMGSLRGPGIQSFTPILNPPEAAILGATAIEPRVVHRGNMEIGARIGLCCSSASTG